jgi:beta-hydroxylase
LHFVLDQKRKAFKNWNRLVYKLTKYSLIVLIVWGVFLI